MTAAGSATSWPWNQALAGWNPFRLDALGLVTLLGHEEVNEALGRLVFSRWVEYLPMLGAFVIAGDRFKEKKPSFNLYNIDQGIHTTELAGWLTRWLMAQDFEKTCSIVQFEIADRPRSFWKWKLVAVAVSFIFTGLLLALVIVADDTYGKVNAVAIIVSIIVRTYVLEANRAAIDQAIDKAQKANAGNRVQFKKCMVVLSDSKAVTLFLPGHLIIPVFTVTPKPSKILAYHAVRWVGWAAFAVHVLTLGNAFLAVQIYCVVLILVPTILVHWKLGCDDSKWVEQWNDFRGNKIIEPYECWIGSKLKATCFEWPLNVEFISANDADKRYKRSFLDSEQPTNPNQKWYRLPDGLDLKSKTRSTKRGDLYAWLNLTVDEELSMGKWDLFPHERAGNKEWWATYNEKKKLIARNPPSIEDMKRRKHITIEDHIREHIIQSRRHDAEKEGEYKDEEPDLGKPRNAKKTVAGPDGMVREQSWQSHGTD